VTLYEPLYRLAGLVKLITAAASWATVVGLVPLVPRALALRSPEVLEREVAARTAELARTNEALQEEMARREQAQREAEDLLRREQQARADAEAANRTKDEFLATVSHELRTPLNAMLGWVHLLRSGHLDVATRDRGLDVLGRNTRTQARLIDDLLDVSRIIAGKLGIEARPIELAPVVEAALEVARPAAQSKGIALEVHLDPAAGPISGDAVRLQQVVWNLLSNAVKFTPSGGRIEVRLERAGLFAELIVRDNGQGITADFMPHVFERFVQADSSSTRAHGGLGLGLAIVRHLVELHGGGVLVHSDGPGRGSTFRVRLPLLPERYRPRPADAPVSMPAGNDLAGLRVLVVDDEDDAREMLDTILARAGAEVTGVASAAEALEVLEGLRPHVLVSDVCMPGEDGYSLIRRIRALPAQRGGLVPAVAVTALARGEERLAALAAGFQMHAGKPIDPRELVTIVKTLSGWTADGAQAYNRATHSP
jgi:signal transduction histidine kinase/ActR/RegA family two-component response regulator